MFIVIFLQHYKRKSKLKIIECCFEIRSVEYQNATFSCIEIGYYRRNVWKQHIYFCTYLDISRLLLKRKVLLPLPFQEIMIVNTCAIYLWKVTILIKHFPGDRCSSIRQFNLFTYMVGNWLLQHISFYSVPMICVLINRKFHL